MISAKPNPLVTIFRETATFNVDGMTIPYAEVEQKALFDLLMEQSTSNPDETDLKKEIARMLKAPRFDIRSPK